jgi:PadR family transcriptional regulator, regulatory protein PadR
VPGRSQGRGRPGSGACGGGEAGEGGGSGRQRRAILETAILLSLLSDESHGYRLVEQIDSLVSGAVCVDPGTVYRLLRGLEDAGCVESSWENAAAGPSRRTYRITAGGQELLADTAVFLENRARAMLSLVDQAHEALSQTAGMAEKGSASVNEPSQYLEG